MNDIVYEDDMEMPNSLLLISTQGLPKGSPFNRRFAEACYTFEVPAVHKDGEPKPTDGQDAPRNRSFFATSTIAGLEKQKNLVCHIR